MAKHKKPRLRFGDIVTIVSEYLEGILVVGEDRDVLFTNAASREHLGEQVAHSKAEFLEHGQVRFTGEDGFSAECSARVQDVTWQGASAVLVLVRDEQSRVGQMESRLFDLERRAQRSEERNRRLEAISEAAKWKARKEEVRAEAAAERWREGLERARRAKGRATKSEVRMRALEQRARRAGEALEEAERRYREARVKALEAGAEAQDASDQEQDLARKIREAESWAREAEARAREVDERAAELDEQVLKARERAAEAEIKSREARERLDCEMEKVEEGRLQLLELEARAQAAEARAQFAEQELNDPLTGLPRGALVDRFLEVQLERCARGEGGVALFTVDLDRFWAVNETFGRKAGDELLRQCSARLHQLLGGAGVLARTGEDDFKAVLFWEGAAEDTVLKARGLAHQIQTALAEPFEVAEERIQLTASVGACTRAEEETTAQEMDRRCTYALSQAKAAGRGQYRIFDSALEQKMTRRLDLETRLEKALEQDEFVLFYQPIVDLRSGEMCGVEALLRWQDPDHGLRLPDEFLDVAEETGLIVPLGQWVVRTGCDRVKRLGDELVLALNFSSRQLLQVEFAERLLEELRLAGFDAGRAVIEVSQEIGVSEPERAEALFAELARWNVGIGIDDFGMGYASLRQLCKMKTRYLKLDRRLVAGLPDEAGDAGVCLGIIRLAFSLGVGSLAEGIENLEQCEFLRKSGCEMAQGFYFSAPVPGEELEALVGHRWTVGGD